MIIVDWIIYLGLFCNNLRWNPLNVNINLQITCFMNHDTATTSIKKTYKTIKVTQQSISWRTPFLSTLTITCSIWFLCTLILSLYGWGVYWRALPAQCPHPSLPVWEPRGPPTHIQLNELLKLFLHSTQIVTWHIMCETFYRWWSSKFTFRYNMKTR